MSMSFPSRGTKAFKKMSAILCEYSLNENTTSSRLRTPSLELFVLVCGAFLLNLSNFLALSSQRWLDWSPLSYASVYVPAPILLASHTCNELEWKEKPVNSSVVASSRQGSLSSFCIAMNEFGLNISARLNGSSWQIKRQDITSGIFVPGLGR